MFSFLTGIVEEKNNNIAVINCNGVGFELNVSDTTIFELPNVGELATSYTYMAVREDAINLFGFASKEEKSVFLKLINVSGIGGKMAIAILSAMPVSDLINTIVTENCDVKIDEISGRTAIVTTYGNITVGILNDYANLKSEHGNVNITKAKGDLNINTEFGNISVASYERNGRFVSVRGNINVKGTGDYIQGVYTQIENTEGSITVDNKVNRLLVTTYGSSKVEITYREIKGGLTNPFDVFQHKVKLNDHGSAIIYMPTQNYKTPFKFLAKGNISGEISGLIPEYGGDKVKSSDDFQYFPSASSENEELCRQSCYFEFYGTIVFRGYLNV